MPIISLQKGRNCNLFIVRRLRRELSRTLTPKPTKKNYSILYAFTAFPPNIRACSFSVKIEI